MVLLETAGRCDRVFPSEDGSDECDETPERSGYADCEGGFGSDYSIATRNSLMLKLLRRFGLETSDYSIATRKHLINKYLRRIAAGFRLFDRRT